MRVSASACVAVLGLAGCSGDPEPPATVSQVVPSAAYNDTPVAVTIQGGPFRPSYTIDLGNGGASIRETAFVALLLPWAQDEPPAAMEALSWKNGTELAAEVPAGLPAGFYDVKLRDPRGNSTMLNGAFESKGPDRDPPTVSIADPIVDSVVAAGTQVPVVLHADDGIGHLAEVEWTLSWLGAPPMTGSCAFDPGSPQASCGFSFTAPTLALTIDSMTITVEAVDTRGNRGMTVTQIWVALPPTVDSFAPSAGPASGMTTISVVGNNFIKEGAATQILIGGSPVDQVKITDPQHMSGTIPAHDPGIVPLVVKTAGASVMPGFFDYVARPDVRAVYPVSGPPSGGTPIEIAGAHFRPGATRILFGDPPFASELLCADYVSEHLIRGITPPGLPGSVAVVASDPIGGDGTATDAFQYGDSTGADGGLGSDGGDAGDALLSPLSCPAPDGGMP
jgi:hypothetical protein